MGKKDLRFFKVALTVLSFVVDRDLIRRLQRFGNLVALVSGLLFVSAGTAFSDPLTQTATHIQVIAPTSAKAGKPVAFKVKALDESGNIVTDYSGTVHFTSTDDAATLPPDATLTDGKGTFSATFKTSGKQTITATDTESFDITGTSGKIAVRPAVATHFQVEAPLTVSARVAFKITVTALDQFENQATAYTGTVHFKSTDTNAKLPADSTLTNGKGKFSVKLKTEGSQTVTAKDTANASITGTSDAITVVSPPPPAALENWHLRFSETPFNAFGGGPLTFAGNTFVWLNGDNHVFTSTDAIDWTLRSLGTPASVGMHGLVYGNGLFVAVGDGGTIVTSPDGITWTIRNSGVTKPLSGLTFSNGIFAAFGPEGGSPLFPTISVLLSTDGINWTVEEFNYHLHAVVYGNGTYILVGDKGVILTSSDGEAWTLRDSGTTASLYSITFENGIYGVVGDNGVILTSSDGMTWTARSSGTTASLYSIIFDNGIFFVRGYSTMLTSSDGITWTDRSSDYMDQISYGGGVFVGLKCFSPPLALASCIIYTSSDGLQWSDAAALYYGGAQLTYLDGQFFVTGSSHPSPYYFSQFFISSSTDGSHWTTRSAGTSWEIALSPPNAGTYGNGLYLVFGPALFVSSDEVNWALRTTEGLTVANNSTAFGNGLFVAVTHGDIVSSADGATWTVRYSGVPVQTVFFEDGLFIAVGDNGAIVTSPDGITWTVRNSDIRYSVTGVAFGNGQFVAVGTSSALLTSPNGVTWTLQNIGTIDLGPRIVYGNGIFIAGRFISADGVTWLDKSSSIPVLYGIAFGKDYFVGVGGAAQDTIYDSVDGTTWKGVQPAGFSCITSPPYVFFANNTFTVLCGNNIYQSDPL